MTDTIAIKSGFGLQHAVRLSLAAFRQAAASAFWAADYFVAHARRRQAIAMLTAMDERQLRDLGISRGEIAAYVDGRFGVRGGQES